MAEGKSQLWKSYILCYIILCFVISSSVIALILLIISDDGDDYAEGISTLLCWLLPS